MRVTTFIYALKDPKTDKIRYIGKANNPDERYHNHINKCRDKNTHKRNWINNLRQEKLKPILEVLEEVPIEQWKEYEKMYIKKYLDEGCDLMNYTEGGDGCTFGNKTSFKKGENGKKIVMLDKDGNYIKTFNMIKDAEKELGTKSTVSSIIAKNQKTSKGFIFLLEEEYKKMSDYDIDKYIEYCKPKILSSNKTSFKNGHIPLHKIRTIYQYSKNGEYIQEWISAAEAGKKLNINIISIGHCARGTSKSAGGFFWTYNKK